MSEHYNFPKTTVPQVVIAIVGALLAPMLVIALVVKLLTGIEASHIADADAAIAAASIAERIKPVAMVDVAAPSSGPHIDKSGEEVVTAVCSACHGSGALGSPKIGDKSAWGPRIKQGYETLIKHAIAGIRQMPARGGNPDLTDGEIANAVAYMANKGGAKFTPPTPAKVETQTASALDKPSTPAPATDSAAKPASESSEPAKTAANSAKSGEEVVKAVCFACHGVGAMGSPKIGDKAAWAPRIAQGYETLVQHAIKGIRMMPAKGGNPSLSDAEVAGAVAYMANQGGAKFTPPSH